MIPIDLRSDTVTRPTPAMKEAMFTAQVGDDVFGEDPTVKELEAYAAALFGKEAALFCPSGTMTNQIALSILTQPYEEVICYKGSHVYLYEGGGAAGNSGLSMKLLEAPQGRLTAEMVRGAINPDDEHFPKSAVVSIENTVNKGGGSCYQIGEVQKISETARSAGLSMHLDGARVFNALIKEGVEAKAYGALFDTISVCLSKGLGAPMGSLIVADTDLIKRAKRIRKVFGGGMRQIGYMAAAGLYALEHNVQRLEEDHRRAGELAMILENAPYIDYVIPPETNIVIFSLKPEINAESFLSNLEEAGILAVSFGGQLIRLVTHLDFDDVQLSEAKQILASL